MSRWTTARAAAVAILSLAAGAPPLLAAEAPTAPPPDAAPALVPRVVEAVSDVPGDPRSAGLGDRLTLTVEHLPLVLAEAGGCQGIVLFLGGLAVPDSSPERCDPDNGHVGFLLERPGGADRTWAALLGSPTALDKPVRVTVGSSASRSYPTLVQPGGQEFRLVVLRKAELACLIVMLIGTAVLVVLLCRKTALLRDPGPGAATERPYSIARFQLAFWSLVVAQAYLFVWAVSSNLDTITDSVLALVGIGSATALGGALIDGDAAAPAGPRRRSHGFLHDLLSDAGGISIQRFQMLTWTLVLGLIFVVSVYKTLEMPQFSAALLGLMGISSGTYLAFKFPERQQAAAKAADGAEAAP